MHPFVCTGVAQGCSMLMPTVHPLHAALGVPSNGQVSPFTGLTLDAGSSFGLGGSGSVDCSQKQRRNCDSGTAPSCFELKLTVSLMVSFS